MMWMIKTTLAVLSVVLGVLAVSVGLAPSASAAIEDCSQGSYVSNGVTLVSCIYVDLDNGRAQARLPFNSQATFAVYDVYITIQRSGTSATNYCQIAFFPSDGTATRVCNAYASNPPGPQAWRADSNVNGVLASSKIISDS